MPQPPHATAAARWRHYAHRHYTTPAPQALAPRFRPAAPAACSRLPLCWLKRTRCTQVQTAAAACCRQRRATRQEVEALRLSPSLGPCLHSALHVQHHHRAAHPGVTHAGRPSNLKQNIARATAAGHEQKGKWRLGSGNGRGPALETEGTQAGKKKKWMVPIQQAAEETKAREDKRMVATRRRRGQGNSLRPPAASAQAGGSAEAGRVKRAVRDSMHAFHARSAQAGWVAKTWRAARRQRRGGHGTGVSMDRYRGGGTAAG